MDINIVCCRCGEVIFEDKKFTKCEHITADEVQDFYKYLDKHYGKKEIKRKTIKDKRF